MKQKIILFILSAAMLSFGLQKELLAEDPNYPRIDLSGYKTWQYRGLNVTPQANYAAGLAALGEVLPSLTLGPLQEQLKLRAIANISKDLSVTYNIQQQPLVPDTYDVEVNYNDLYELSFGDLTANFEGNEFATASKNLNGMMFKNKLQNQEITLVPAGNLRSTLQLRAEQPGKNIRGPYNLGHNYILESSERIELNHVELKRGIDYTIDYFGGIINFTRIINETDTFSYTYEYSNVTDLFFPAQSSKDFFGLQGRFKLDPSTLNWWAKKPVPRALTSRAEEVFPTSLDRTGGEVPEKEAAGKYTLSNTPIKRFSEVVTFQGAALRQNQDYWIDYDQGEITLLLAGMPVAGNPLLVSYDYFETGVESDNIAADGSRGPYDLSHKNIVVNSESVRVDGKVVGAQEYVIDYDHGSINFRYDVSNTSSIIVNYQYLLFLAPPAETTIATTPYQLTVGGTYLKETAKGGGGAVTADFIDSFTGAALNQSDNTIYLTYFPVLSTTEGASLVVKKDGVSLEAGVDYVVPTTTRDPATGNILVAPPLKLPYVDDPADPSDGYSTGTIKLLGTVEATSNVVVLYTYTKNIYGRVTGGGNGSRGPYYLQPFHNPVPGSDKVEVWQGASPAQVYIRNASFESDAGALGYSINYDKENPYLMFNQNLSSQQKFTVYFQYLPPASSVSGKLSRDVTGLDIDYQLGTEGLLRFKGNIARSQTDQVITTLNTIESFANFTPTVQPVVQLAHAPLSENSERVFVNEYLINRDKDYLIDYNSGKIVLYSLALSSQDAVVVQYDYPDPSGIASGATKVGTAYKFELDNKLGPLSTVYSLKQIGFDFTPLGVNPIGIGSSRRDFSANYEPGAQKLKLGYAYQEVNDPLQPAATSDFTRNFKRTYSLAVSPYNLVDINVNQEDRQIGTANNNLDQTTIEADQSTTTAGFKLVPLKYSVLGFQLSGDLKKINATDQTAATAALTNYNHLNSIFNFTSRVSLGVDLQNSASRTTSTTLDARILGSKSEQQSYDLSLDLTFGPLKKLGFYSKFIDQKLTTSLPTLETMRETKNMALNLNFIPNNLLSGTVNYNRSEIPSVSVLGQNPLDERLASTLLLTPAANLAAAWGHSQNTVLLENGARNSGRSDNYSLNWKVFSLEKLELRTAFNLFSSFGQSLAGTTEAATRIDSLSQDYSLPLKPLTNLIITPAYHREDYRSELTASGLLETRMQVPACSVLYTPLEWLNFNLNYTQKVTTRLSDNVDLTKKNAELVTTLRIFGWGTIVQDLAYEHNGGEVTGSGTLPETNFRKLSNIWTFNVNLPQNNPLLDSIVLSATYKQIKYENLLAGRSGDNFDAASARFEGTLNF